MAYDRRELMGDPEEALRAALSGFQTGLWTAVPGIIQSFNTTAHTVEVQPAIKAKLRKPDGSLVSTALPLLVDVPVMWPSGGGFTLTFPIATGDECLVVFSSRCIDAWWQSGGVQEAMEARMNDLSDGFAFVGVRSQVRLLPSVSTAATQLRSDDGATYVQVGTNEIKLTPDGGTTFLELTPGLIRSSSVEINTHATSKNTWDAGGTGFVYTPGHIDTYTNGVPSTGHAPNPPEVPT